MRRDGINVVYPNFTHDFAEDWQACEFPTSALALKSGSRALLGREIPLGATLHQSQPAISDFLGGRRTQALGEPVPALSHTARALAVGMASPCAH